MAFEDDQDNGGRRKGDPASGPQSGDKNPSKKKRTPAPEVGKALRSAYEQAVNEDIPPEMLDLLGKLG